ncbi:MAG: hypothetical protein AAGH74_05130 [Pseudomonadota bacterium]
MDKINSGPPVHVQVVERSSSIDSDGSDISIDAQKSTINPDVNAKINKSNNNNNNNVNGHMTKGQFPDWKQTDIPLSLHGLLNKSENIVKLNYNVLGLDNNPVSSAHDISETDLNTMVSNIDAAAKSDPDEVKNLMAVKASTSGIRAGNITSKNSVFRVADHAERTKTATNIRQMVREVALKVLGKVGDIDVAKDAKKFMLSALKHNDLNKIYNGEETNAQVFAKKVSEASTDTIYDVLKDYGIKAHKPNPIVYNPQASIVDVKNQPAEPVIADQVKTDAQIAKQIQEHEIDLNNVTKGGDPVTKGNQNIIINNENHNNNDILNEENNINKDSVQIDNDALIANEFNNDLKDLNDITNGNQDFITKGGVGYEGQNVVEGGGEGDYSVKDEIIDDGENSVLDEAEGQEIETGGNDVNNDNVSESSIDSVEDQMIQKQNNETFVAAEVGNQSDISSEGDKDPIKRMDQGIDFADLPENDADQYIKNIMDTAKKNDSV